MRRTVVLTAVLLMLVSVKAFGQNVQLYYDFCRKSATTTIEMFRPDAVGNTFFFVDLDYTPKVSGAYWEFSREFCFWQESKVNWLSLHVEYNGGLNTEFGSFNNAWLGGLTYSGHSKDYSKTWSLSAMYKLIPGTVDARGRKQIHNFQITGVWNLDFFSRWISFYGYADFSREVNPVQGTEYIFAAEPQFWVNLDKIKGMEKSGLSVGTEVELACNLYGRGFVVMPAVGVKWTLNRF